jgi:TonB family protein
MAGAQASVSSGVVPPRLIEFVEAEYPEEARAAGSYGTVHLRLTIDASGSVTDIEVVDAPHELLGQAAQVAARRFRFEPARRNDVSVAARIAYAYEFRLLPAAGAIEGQIFFRPPTGSAGVGPQAAPPVRRAASGARVVLIAPDGTELAATTDPDGRYRFEALPPGRYVLRATLLGVGTTQGEAPVVAGQTTRGALVLEPPPEGHGLPGAPASAAAGVIDVTVQGRTRADELRQSSEAIKVVETDQARRESADLAEVLARTQGVGVRRSGGLGAETRFSLNGLTDDQIRFFVDGVPIDFTGYALGLANVPVNLVRRIEIHSGVVPVRFGADALGGAVNLVTAGPRRGIHGGASYQAGSYGTHRATASVQNLASTGFFTRADGFLDTATNDYPVDVEVPNEVGRPEPVRVNRFHDGYRAMGGGAELGWVGRPWAERLTLYGFVTDSDRDIQNNAVMTVPYGGVTYGETVAGGNVRYEDALGDAWHVEALAGYAHTRGHYRDVDNCVYDWFGECVVERPRGGEREGQPRDRLTWENGGYARAHVRWEPRNGHELSLSVAPTLVTRTGDERRQSSPDARDPQTAERELVTWVNGISYRVQLFDNRLENTVFAKQYVQRLRAEDPVMPDVFVPRDRETHRVGFGNGVRYWLAEPLALKLSYEWATRLPRSDEVFGDANTLLPNLDLDPEVSHNVNVGLLLALPGAGSGSWNGELLGFLRDADDLIVRLSDDTFQFYQNVYSARSMGVEASLRWEAATGWLTLDANATYQSFRNTSNEGLFTTFRGDRIPNQPWFFANFSAKVAAPEAWLGGDELSLVGYVRYVHEFFRGWESLGLREYKQVVPGYVMPSAALTYLYQVPDLSVSSTLEVDNITDAVVQDYYGVQRPGRTFAAKLAVSY